MQSRRLLPALALGALASTPALLSAQQHRICDVEGERIYTELGTSIARLGDLDKDGRPDFAVGGRETAGLGKVRVYSSADGRVLFKLSGIALDEQLGQSLASIGDVNKDGYDDFVAGAPQDCG